MENSTKGLGGGQQMGHLLKRPKMANSIIVYILILEVQNIDILFQKINLHSPLASTRNILTQSVQCTHDAIIS